MSLILAISCKDRIVIAADGRAVDYDTKKPRADVKKIFELTTNSAVLIAGEGLIDELDEYMNRLVQNIRAKGNMNITDIAIDVKEDIDKREWAEWKDKPKDSHMEALVVGYDNGEPRVYTVLDNRQLVRCWGNVLGSWGKALDYLVDNISDKYKDNTTKIGNKVATEMLIRAEKENSVEIGGQNIIWHVMPDYIKKLSDTDIKKLRKRWT